MTSDAQTAAADDGGSELGAGFGRVRKQVNQLIDDEQFTKVRKALGQAAERPDTSRTLEGNLWLYRTLGEVHEKEDDPEGAAEAYRRAFELDPTSFDVLEPLVDFLLSGADAVEADWAVKPLQTVLVQHAESLDEQTLAAVFRRLGEIWDERGDADRASAYLDRALEASRGDAAALALLLDTMVSVGDPTDVIELRRQLLESLESPGERAEALLELGDDWLERFNDPGRAIGAYEDAIGEAPDNPEAHQKVVSVAAHVDDWERAYRAQVELSRLAEDDSEQADRLVDAAKIARDRLWEPEKALEGFRRALDLDPRRFDEAFKPITAILMESEDWEGLEGAYRDAIELQAGHEDVDTELLAVLWYKLAEVYRLHLDQPGQAIEAYDAASELFPSNPEFHRQAANLAEEHSEYIDTAIDHLEHLIELEPGNADLLDRLGRAYLRRDDVDRALWHFRVLDFRGESLEQKARQFVERLDRSIYNSPERPLGEQLRRERVYPETLDQNVSDVFRILFPVLQDWTAEMRSEYGLGRNDQVDLEDPLAFNNIYRAIGEALEFGTLPQVWRKSDQQGAVKTSLADRALIVGDDLFGSGHEKAIACSVARKLTLSLEPFYLVGLRPTRELQTFFLLARQLVQPEFEFEQAEHTQQAFNKIKKTVTGDRREALGRAVDAATGGGEHEAPIGAWVEGVEDAANRVALLFCDDLEVCADRIRNEQQAFSQRSVQERLDSLATWSISEDFFAVRDQMGISTS